MKARPNKLDPFAARIDDWEREGKTLAEMQADLREDGCKVALSSLSEFLARKRQELAEREMFAVIASGGKMNRELDAAFAANPAPEVERLIDISKTLIMTLQVNGRANPKLLALANGMQQTVLDYMSGKARAALEGEKLKQGERKLKLLEEAAERASKTEAVLDSNLSSDDQAKRIREIFKR